MENIFKNVKREQCRETYWILRISSKNIKNMIKSLIKTVYYWNKIQQNNRNGIP